MAVASQAFAPCSCASEPQPARLRRGYLRAFSVALRVTALLCLAPAAYAAAEAAAAPRVFLEDFTWSELRDAVAQGRTTAIIPVGGTEQSGPALALGKHNSRVRFLSSRIARELGDAVVAPVVAYVPEGAIAPPSSHMRFPGTISIPTQVFDATLESIAGSLRAHGFRCIVLLGDHGGYQRDLVRVAERLDRRWAAERVRVFAPPEYYRAATEGFAKVLREHGYRDDEIGTHAALADTSLQLAVDPDSVRTDLLRAGGTFDEHMGVYGGDPRRASAELGQLGIDAIVRETVAAIRRLRTEATPR